jgi:hypothetical protein
MSASATASSPLPIGLSGFTPTQTALDDFINAYPAPSADDDPAKKRQSEAFQSFHLDLYWTSNLNKRLLKHVDGHQSEAHLVGFDLQSFEECNRNFIDNRFNLTLTKALADSAQSAERAYLHAQGGSRDESVAIGDWTQGSIRGFHQTARGLVQQWDALHQRGFLHPADISGLSIRIIEDWEPGSLLASASDENGDRWEYETYNQARGTDKNDKGGPVDPGDDHCESLIHGTDTGRFKFIRVKNAIEEGIDKVSNQVSGSLHDVHERYSWTYEAVAEDDPTDSEADEKAEHSEHVDNSVAPQSYLSEKGDKSEW